MSLLLLSDHEPLPLADDHLAEVLAGEGHNHLQAVISDAAEPPIGKAKAADHSIGVLEGHAVKVDFRRDSRLRNIELRNVVALLAAHRVPPQSARLNYRVSRISATHTNNANPPDSDLHTTLGEGVLNEIVGISWGLA